MFNNYMNSRKNIVIDLRQFSTLQHLTDKQGMSV